MNKPCFFSDVCCYENSGWGHWMWRVDAPGGGTSGWTDRDGAIEIAAAWWPDLLDDMSD